MDAGRGQQNLGQSLAGVAERRGQSLSAQTARADIEGGLIGGSPITLGRSS